MRKSEAARYARWAATAAIVLVAIVVGVYFYRAWEVRRARKEVPPVLPATVEQSSRAFSLSKVEGDRTLFTVRASQTTQYKEGEKSELEDVWITIHGRAGQRFDNIHTRSCDYEPSTGRIRCAGDVQIDLESAEEARQRPGERVIHVETSAISFDRNTGQATTDQPVEFRFPYGHGRGVGVTYSTREATIRLRQDVELTLTPAARPGAARRSESDEEPIVLTGASMEYRREERTLHLLPPVRICQGQREIDAGSVAVEFDSELRARRLVANGRPRLRSVEAGSNVALSADQLIVRFRRNGSAERVIAQGNVAANRKGPRSEDRLESQRLELELGPARNEPRLATAAGAVKIESRPPRAGRDVRRLTTEQLRLTFAPRGAGSERHISNAETLAPGVIELATADETTRLRGARLTAAFDAQSHIQSLAGDSGVEVERRFSSGLRQVSRSQEFVATFGADGEWTEVEQSGAVESSEGERTLQADRARVVRATDTATLTGSATLADPLTRTTADTIIIEQRTGEIHAQGNVRTSYRTPERSGVTNLAPEPAHISADDLRAGRTSGRALYSGHARLWQGDAVIEAASMELFRDTRRLEARGGILGIFPQASSGVRSAAANAGKELWRFRAASLTYWSGESRARLEENVSAESPAGRIYAPAMDLFFGAGPGEVQRLARGVATGGVTVRQGSRRGAAEQADYVVAEQKFVLSGGKPTLFDPELGTTTGRQLTFFLADDKILIDSEEGSRTLTKHRVEK